MEITEIDKRIKVCVKKDIVKKYVNASTLSVICFFFEKLRDRFSLHIGSWPS